MFKVYGFSEAEKEGSAEGVRLVFKWVGTIATWVSLMKIVIIARFVTAWAVRKKK